MGMKFTPTLGERIKIGMMSFSSDAISDNYTDKNGLKLGNGVVQASYLLNRDRLKQLLEAHGYKLVHNDYGLVKRTGAGLPIYLKSADANGVTRNDLIPIGNVDSDDIYDEKTKEVRPSNWYGNTDKALYLAGQHRSTLYYNPTDHKYYQKAWDVNDYGGAGGSTASLAYLGLGQLLDKIGSPVVVTSGFQEVKSNNYNKVNPFMNKYAKQHSLVKDNSGYHYQSPDVVIMAPKLVKRKNENK